MDYFLTVFDKDGSLLLNESFQYDEDQAAIEHGKNRLAEEKYQDTTHRMTRNGKLLLFHR
ncbi:YhzD-like protein [Alteribacillus persepolensis]|uniref:YhzD-like protein n=1 Tax=Alteribacillus persepolensis TaxID=568899 RepID=A0A1G8DCY4_9BACI|nr:YhzD family protein [Alteribacillus persepolensis]SDH55592.1 YhzD-like protein [Alteribacillus persepolensis]